jgi:hypothetical protein
MRAKAKVSSSKEITKHRHAGSTMAPTIRALTHIFVIVVLFVYTLVASGQVFRAWIYIGKSTYLSGSWVWALVMFGPPPVCIAALRFARRWPVTRINSCVQIICLVGCGAFSAIFLAMLITSIARIDR